MAFAMRSTSPETGEGTVLATAQPCRKHCHSPETCPMKSSDQYSSWRSIGWPRSFSGRSYERSIPRKHLSAAHWCDLSWLGLAIWLDSLSAGVVRFDCTPPPLGGIERGRRCTPAAERNRRLSLEAPGRDDAKTSTGEVTGWAAGRGTTVATTAGIATCGFLASSGRSSSASTISSAI